MAKPAISFLTDEEVESIHLASLEILENVGIYVPVRECLEMLARNGANVEYEKHIAKVPASVVMSYVGKAPREFTLYSRNPKFNMTLEPGEVYFELGAGPTRFLDIDTGQPRDATLSDLEKLVKIADALDNFSNVSELVTPTDVPPEVIPQHIWACAFKNSCKHVQMYVEDADYVRDAIAMASVLLGSEENVRKEPVIDFFGCIGSPLTYEKKLVSGLMEAAKHSIPVHVQSGTMAGANGPVTLAGTLALCNAEILSGITIMQMANPGTPVIYANWSRIFDIKSLNVSFGSPEFVLLRIAAGELVHHYYHVPLCNSGFQTDSKLPDIQNGYEKYVTLIGMLAGSNLMAGATVAGAGWIDPLGWMIDDELAAAYKQIMKGFTVDRETLALDIIRSVGPGPGRNFLASKHTRQHMREQQWLDFAISDRRPVSVWEKDGAKDARQRARMILQEKLRTREFDPLPVDVQSELDSIVESARKRHKSSR